MIGEVLRVAFSGLLAHRLRSALTVLSIAIGVGSVILLMSIGAGVSAMIRAETEAYGSPTTMTVLPGGGFADDFAYDEFGRPVEPDADAVDFDSWVAAPSDEGVTAPLTDADLAAVMERTSHVSAAAGTVSSYGEVSHDADGALTAVPVDQVLGTTAGYLDARGLQLAEGTFLTAGQVAEAERVAVVGSRLAEQLFMGAPALGSTVRHLDASWTVVGVLAPSGGPEFGTGDLAMFVPADALRSAGVPGEGYEQLLLDATATEEVPRARAEVLAAIHASHGLLASEPVDVEVLTAQDDLAFVRVISVALQGLGLALASVSLAVGGIGVMNMMLVSVTERTREIGVRAAVGARRRHLMGQFLLEAVVLCLVGGLLGLGVGSLGQLVEISGFRPVVTPLAVGLALGSAVATGLLFGWLPARRAARMRPVDALRHE